MELSALFCVLGVAAIMIWTISNWLWFKPKKIEKFLRDQGLKGSPYRFGLGDLKEMVQMSSEAKSKPMNLTHDIAPRVLPFFHKSVATHGKLCFTWMGTKPMVLVSEPTIIRESLYIPGSRFLPTKDNKRMKEIHREVKASIKSIIDKRVLAMKNGETSKQDLLGILLDSNYNEIKQQGSSNFGLTIEEVIEECKLFYFAGQETTGNMIVWTMILLAQHTDWQTRAREEVLHAIGDKRPDIDGLGHLKVINMIFNEVLRLYPPAAVLRRLIHEETKLGNLTLPAGTLIQLNALLLHHDKDIWGNDVNEFKPERFSEGVSKVTKGQGSYLPFGGGPRICIGQNFAMLEAKMVLAMILQRFSFELSPSYSHAPHTIITLQPQFGAHLILHKL
ncbi:hypothetical protein L1887_16082 [Cichorium endivia]|nr:hypothetical protein L1887_16082 [Cichorium endivia]